MSTEEGLGMWWQFSLQAQQAVPWLLLLFVGLAFGWRARWPTLVAMTAFLTFDLIVFGAFVRLSDSGLGCPDWPGCYGKFSPIQAAGSIAEEVARQGGEHGWVSPTKAWIEMIHRYWASFIGILIVVMVLRSWKERLERRSAAGRAGLEFNLVLLAVVILQGLFGKWTVTFKLMPWVVTVHLLGGLLLWSLLVWATAAHVHRIQPVDVSAALRRRWWLAAAFLLIQIALGGWTSTNYAALACGGLPLCQGQWWPDLDFANAFDLTRPMGRTDDGAFLSLQALAAIHLTHRAFAFVALAAVALFAWSALRWSSLRRWAMALLGAMLLQVVIGLATVAFDQPLLLAVAHTALAALLVGVLVACGYKIRIFASSARRADSTATVRTRAIHG
jgi:cytochrome c oxidase assembly protein subunit 15